MQPNFSSSQKRNRHNQSVVSTKPLSRLPHGGEAQTSLEQSSSLENRHNRQPISPLPIWEGRGDSSNPTRRSINTIRVRSRPRASKRPFHQLPPHPKIFIPIARPTMNLRAISTKSAKPISRLPRSVPEGCSRLRTYSVDVYVHAVITV